MLRDNYAQTRCMVTRGAKPARCSTSRRSSSAAWQAGRLNRKHRIPARRRGDRRAQGRRRGLTSPELAVLLAYSKIELYDEVLALRERFPAQIGDPPRRREIIPTNVVNSMINRVGPPSSAGPGLRCPGG